MKLAAKFITLLVLGVLILIAVDAYVSVQREIDIFETDMKRDAREIVEDLRSLLAYVWRNGGQQQVLDILDKSNATHRLIQIRWVWLDVPPDDPHHAIVDGQQLGSLSNERIVTLTHLDERGNKHLLTYARVAIDGPRIAALELSEAFSQAPATMRYFVSRTLVIAAVTFVLGIILVGIFGVEFVGKPLGLIIEKTRRIGRGDFSQPLELNRHDEFGELAIALNSMCEQLSNAQRKINEESVAKILALKQLRHADRLRTVGRLASGIAHEIGTPLNVVSGRANMIATGRLLPDETTKSAEVIKAESDRIADIVRQLLNFARHSTPQRRSVDLRQLVRQTRDFLAPLAEKKRVNILHVQAEESFVCDVDEDQVKQVLTNLLVNAIHAMQDGGDVTTELGRSQVRPPDGQQVAEGKFVWISVRDEGQGIEKGDMDQLFEPFFTTKGVGEGTGLGLSIAYGIVQEHGGWIDVESQVDRGSKFTVYFPAKVG